MDTVILIQLYSTSLCKHIPQKSSRVFFNNTLQSFLCQKRTDLETARHLKQNYHLPMHACMRAAYQRNVDKHNACREATFYQ